MFDNTAIVFTNGAFVYQVFASGAGIDDRRDELIDAALALYERVPVDRPQLTAPRVRQVAPPTSRHQRISPPYKPAAACTPERRNGSVDPPDMSGLLELIGVGRSPCSAW